MSQEPVKTGDSIPLSSSLIQKHGIEDLPASAKAIVERYRQILHSAVETGIITMDVEGLVTGWSDGAQQILGWSEEEILDCSLARIFPAESGGEQSLRTELGDAISKGTGGSEGWRLRKDGSRLWAIGETKPLFDEQMGAIGFVKILRDRTRERNVESVDLLRKSGELLIGREEFPDVEAAAIYEGI